MQIHFLPYHSFTHTEANVHLKFMNIKQNLFLPRCKGKILLPCNYSTGSGGCRGCRLQLPPPKLPPNLIFTLIFLTNSVDLIQGEHDSTNALNSRASMGIPAPGRCSFITRTALGQPLRACHSLNPALNYYKTFHILTYLRQI